LCELILITTVTASDLVAQERCSKRYFISVNQSKCYFRSNNTKLQCSKCYSTRMVTRKALRSSKLVA